LYVYIYIEIRIEAPHPKQLVAVMHQIGMPTTNKRRKKEKKERLAGGGLGTPALDSLCASFFIA